MTKPTQNESIAMLTTSAGQALEYSRQALAVLDMWINTLAPDDGKIVFSFPAGGRYLVDTSIGLQSMRPLMDDEILFTVESAARFLKKIGYQVIPPAA